MKLTVTTTHNFAKKVHFDSYMERLKRMEVLPGCKGIVNELLEKGEAGHSTVIDGTESKTVYRIENINVNES